MSNKDYSTGKPAQWDAPEQYKLELSPAAKEAKARITFCIASRQNIINAYLAIQMGYDYGYEQANLSAAEAILADRKAEHLATYGEDIRLTIRRV